MTVYVFVFVRSLICCVENYLPSFKGDRKGPIYSRREAKQSGTGILIFCRGLKVGRRPSDHWGALQDPNSHAALSLRPRIPPRRWRSPQRASAQGTSGEGI